MNPNAMNANVNDNNNGNDGHDNDNHSGLNTGELGAVSSANDFSESTGSAAIESPDLQKEFSAIRDTLQKVKLQSNCRLNESPMGIKKQDKPTFNVLQRNARYLETALKLIQVASSDSKLSDIDFNQYLIQLEVVLRAGIDFNQQEYQALLVGSQFDPTTTKFFRVMQRSENCFTPQALVQLKLAAEITSASQHTQQQQRQPYNGGYRGGQARQRGGYRRPYNRQYQNRGAQFSQFNYGRPPPRPDQGDEM